MRTGALKPADRDAIIGDALAQVPAMNNSNLDDTRAILNDAKDEGKDV